MTAFGYSVEQVYRVVLMGDDLQHLTILIDAGKALHDDDCLACVRIKRAIHLAEHHEIGDPRPAA